MKIILLGFHDLVLFTCLTKVIGRILACLTLFCLTIGTKETIVGKFLKIFFVNLFAIFWSFRCILRSSLQKLKFAFTFDTINKISHATIHQLIFNLIHFLPSKNFLKLLKILLQADSKEFLNRKMDKDMGTYTFLLH